ncbi:hypothetical protein KW797_00545 [Candidatus Parcubacteria bacterium]|nr:hypothetical protein [Candidatus Parcubacteria bacterium]
MHTVKKLPKSMVEITGEIPEKEFGKHRERAVKNLSAKVEIDGFRKGFVPENVLIGKVGEMALLEEMAELALGELYPTIVAKEELDVIGYPSITITKIGRGSVLGFKIETAVMPELELPNYKKIAKEEMAKDEPTEATEAEIDGVIADIRKSRSSQKDEKGEPILPELTDEFVKALGDFATVEDFNKKLKENIAEEKKFKLREKKRLATLERIGNETQAEIPEVLIDAEAEKMVLRLRQDVERLGIKFDEYLKNVKKTEAEIKSGWRPDAERRAKTEIVLMKIAEAENIKPTEEEIDKEVRHVLEHYKDAKEERVRDYVASVIQNEKVLEFLESQK